MTTARHIGSDFRSAVDWMQQQLRITRPIAEDTVWSAIGARTVIWDDGVYLLEDDDEIEKRKKATILRHQKGHNVARKWSRLQFRNKNRNGRMSQSAQRTMDNPSRAERKTQIARDPALPFLSGYDESALSPTWQRIILAKLAAEMLSQKDDDAVP